MWNLHQSQTPVNPAPRAFVNTDPSAMNTTAAQSFSQKACLLLVEDNPTNQAIAQAFLRRLGFSADAAFNGIEALQKLTEAPVDCPYTLVLMDCQMPKMDGYEATRKIRAGRAGKRNQTIPIIAITANAMPSNRQQCLEAGMNDFFSKPIRKAMLTKILEKWG